VRDEVLLQGGYVSVPACSVDVLGCRGPAEEPEGLLVCLGGAEPGQVAAGGQVLIQGTCQRSLLIYVKQGAIFKGCRDKRAHVRK